MSSGYRKLGEWRLCSPRDDEEFAEERKPKSGWLLYNSCLPDGQPMRTCVNPSWYDKAVESLDQSSAFTVAMVPGSAGFLLMRAWHTAPLGSDAKYIQPSCQQRSSWLPERENVASCVARDD